MDVLLLLLLLGLNVILVRHSLCLRLVSRYALDATHRRINVFLRLAASIPSSAQWPSPSTSLLLINVDDNDAASLYSGVMSDSQRKGLFIHGRYAFDTSF